MVGCGLEEQLLIIQLRNATMPKGRPKTQAWKLLATILYGRHDWIRRGTQGHITVATTQLATSLGRRPEMLQTDLEFLAGIELLDSYYWHGHFFTAKLVAPPSTAWLISTKGSIDIESSMYE